MTFQVEVQVVSLEMGIVYAIRGLLVESGAGVKRYFVHLHNLRLQQCSPEKATE